MGRSTALFNLKKIPLIVVIGTVIGISINKSILMLKATIFYQSTAVPWFEWMNYLFLSIAVLLLPIFALFFLDSLHIRRLLRIFLLIIIFFNLMELIEGIFAEIDQIWLFERTYNVLFILIESFSAALSWIILFLHIGGRSILPIPITTNVYAGYTIFEYILKNPIKNLIEFVRKPKSHNKKIVNIVLVFNIVIFSGLLVTMLPENSVITLQRPNHEMRVSYWGGNNLDNSTLDIIGARGGRIFAWISDWSNEAQWKRFKDRGVEVIMVDGFESDETKWEQDFQEITAKMDLLDTQPNTGIVGFADDMEMLTRIIEYNQTYYNKYVDFIRNKTNYVESRGYQYHITQWLSTIGDLRDGDDDMAVVYKNPFHPVQFENLSSIGWMIYRSEMAIKYDEPFDYFTHHWASQVRSYMGFVEEKYGYEEGFWKNKSTMSIGVASDSAPWTFNHEINPKAKQNIMKEIQICHVNQISEVIIFYAGNTNSMGEGTSDFFECIGGNAGLLELYDMLDNYEDVKITYKRRATFLGNLKMLSNLSGSVFGLLYSDAIYDSQVAYLVFLWLAIYISCSVSIGMKKMERNPAKRIETESDNFSAVIRLVFIGLLTAIFMLTLTSFWFPELFQILGSLDYFLGIYY